MNTDASNVGDINIDQSKERLSIRMAQYLSQSIIHPVQEWSWS